MSWNFSGDRPIYMQIVEQMKLKILSGEFEAGERLPAIRDLAGEAAVNPNTMQRAFSELEQLGLVYAQRTAGRFITDDEEKIKDLRRLYAEKTVKEFITEMRTLGYGNEEIIDLFKDIVDEEEEQ